MDDSTFESLIDYTAERSKRQKSKMNLSDAVREVLDQVLKPTDQELR